MTAHLGRGLQVYVAPPSTPNRPDPRWRLIYATDPPWSAGARRMVTVSAAARGTPLRPADAWRPLPPAWKELDLVETDPGIAVAHADMVPLICHGVAGEMWHLFSAAITVPPGRNVHRALVLDEVSGDERRRHYLADAAITVQHRPTLRRLPLQAIPTAGTERWTVRRWPGG